MAPFVLAVTGVPCSGKTTLSRKLGIELGAKVVGLNELIEEAGLCVGYDAQRDTRVVDVKRLRGLVAGMVEGDTILDGLLSHSLKVTHILVLRCDPRLLCKRMGERGYSRRKVLENIEAEYSGVILYESLKACDNVLEADNTVGADIEEVRRWLRKGGKRVKEKDWTAEFSSFLESSA